MQMQHAMLTTFVTIVAITLFVWIAWRKARSGQQASLLLQQEEARLTDLYLDRKSSFNRDRPRD